MDVNIIIGNEPYLADYKKRKLIGNLNLPELNLAAFPEFTIEVVDFLLTYPIVDTVKVAVVMIQDLAELDNVAFHDYINRPCQSGRLIIVARNYNIRSQIYGKLKKMDLLIYCEKEKSIDRVKKILQQELGRLGASMDDQVMQLFMEKENYFKMEEINLYNLVQDLRNVVSYAAEKQVTVADVEKLIEENDDEKIFEVAKFLINRDIINLKKQAAILSPNAIGTLFALLREFRIAYKAKYFTLQEIDVKYAALKALNKNVLIMGMELILDTTDKIKRGKISSKQALEFVFLQILMNISNSRRIDYMK